MSNPCKPIVISAPNLTKSGFLSILQEVYSWAKLQTNIPFIFIVHKRELLHDPPPPHIKFIEFPRSKKNWLVRLFLEYIYFYFLSRKIRPKLWLSLQDFSSNVLADRQAVYCHNPCIFDKFRLKEFLYDWKHYLFACTYKYAYALNIKSNDYVIVQQNWMAEEFRSIFGIDNLLVARPEHLLKISPTSNFSSNHTAVRFFYPAFPRPFKGFEIACEAFSRIAKEIPFELILTIDGTENLYSKKIHQQYHKDPRIKFIGLQPKAKIYQLYQDVDAMVFPSKLETWGLPLSEFAMTKKPIFALDRMHCRETLSGYKNVSFFDEKNIDSFVNSLTKFILRKEFHPNPCKVYPADAQNWDELFRILIGDKNYPAQ